jgi:hypothetical protein
MNELWQLLTDWSGTFAVAGALLIAVLSLRPRRRWYVLTALTYPAAVALLLSVVGYLSHLAVSSEFKALTEALGLAATRLAPSNVVIGWMCTELKSLWCLPSYFDPAIWPRVLALLLPSALFGLCVYGLFGLRYTFFRLDIEQRRGVGAAPRRVVIMGLSPPGAREVPDRQMTAGMDLAGAIDPTGPLGGAPGRPAHPWQQNLRVLNHHLARPLAGGHLRILNWLRRARAHEPNRLVYVMPSLSKEGAPGSDRFVDAFIEFSEKIIGNTPKLPLPRFIPVAAAEYDDLDQLEQSLRRVIARAYAEGARFDEISIDTTPGLKLFSIAGASVTYGNPAEFTYVSTIPPFELHRFDARAVVQYRRMLSWPD